MKRAVFTSALAAVIVLGAVAACDSTTGLRDERVSLTFQVPSSGSFAADGGIALQVAADPITRNGHTLDLRNVDVEFSRVDLQSTDRLDDTDTDLGGDDGESIDDDSDQRNNVQLRGPFTVALPLGGGMITPVAVDIPFGTYDQVKLRVSRIRLRGLFDAQAFDVLVPVREKFEVRLDPPLVVDQNTDPLNVTIQVVPSEWLIDRNGTLIDPRSFATDDRLVRRFRSRIRADIRGLEDANRNGRDDRDTDEGR